MSEKKSDFWVIAFKTTCVAVVCFDKPVTKEEAKRLFIRQNIEDIVDSEWDFPTSESDITSIIKDW